MNMKLIIPFVAVLISGFLVSGCEELPPKITPCQTDRVILVEEFTGVSCVNCPTGTEKLEQLASQNPGKLVIVGIHAGYWAQPNAGNQNTDFRCADGSVLESTYLGPVSGYPAATINRAIFEGENELPIGLNKWAGNITRELCKRPIASLSITPTYNEQDRKATVTVDVVPSDFFNEVLEEDLAITIMITESDIEAYQKTPTGSDYEYKHKHVLRDVITDNASGDILITEGNAFTTQQKVITDYEVSADWDPEHCHVVAFIHYKDDNNKYVLQAAETKLQ